MIDLALHPVTRDLIFPIRPIEGAARVTQAVNIRLRTWLGEWFLDITHGVPYLEQIMRKVPNFAIVESELRSQILDVEGVRAITFFELEFDNHTRICSIRFEAESAEGLITGKLNVNV